MKKSYLLPLIFISFSLFVVSLALSLFTSCSPSGSTSSGTATTTTTTTTPPPPAEVQCDKDSGDTTAVCSERDSCADTCGEIYAKAREKGECEELTIQQVGELEEIHTVLTSGNKPDLEDLSEEEEDYELDDLKCYLSIGGKGWVDWIEKTSDGADHSDTRNILEWLAENDDVTAILADDTNDGEEIIEALLLKLDTPANLALSESSKDFNNLGSNDFASIPWHLNIDTLEIAINTNNNTTDIKLDSDDDTNIYDALSAFSLDNNHHNIFSYSAEKNNQKLFNLAFSLLNRICDSAGDDEEAVACKRALLCWTASQTDTSSANTADEDDLAGEDVWDLADVHEETLKEGSEYDECSSAHFAEIDF